MDLTEKITALVFNEASLLNDIMSESNNMANHYPEQMLDLSSTSRRGGCEL